MQRVIRHLLGAALAELALAGLPAPTAAADAVAPVIPMPAAPFDLADVRLLDGPFKHAMELNAAYLLALEPDRLLHNFRAFAGLTPKGAAYGGWEADTIAGHTLGHYLSALAFLFASTGDVRCKERADYIVAELRACQEAIGTGLVFGFPRGKEIFEEVRRGDIRTRPFDLNGCWVPLYNLHKTFAGLADVHRHCGNAQALRVATALADFLIGVFADLDDGRMQTLLDCEHGGLNESFAELFALTGEARYRAMAERIYHRRVLDPLAAREDRLEGLHGNTQIPKVIGLARLYELTGNERYGAAARFFWETVVTHHTYANGGWFSFGLKVDPARPVELLCEYWGGERNRVFDILVDDTVIATQRLDGARDGAFIEEVYPVPPALTAGKNKVRVMLKGHPEKTAGSLFGCRTLRREEPPAGESR